MTYRELLEKCKNNSGCLATREQKESEAKMKYQLWVARSNEEYRNKEK
ncbi:MAG: hypothetical protein ABFD25_16180 [Clostridiaceae bacterium]